MEYLGGNSYFTRCYLSSAPMFTYSVAYLSGILAGAKINIGSPILVAFITISVCCATLFYYLAYFKKLTGTLPLKIALLSALFSIAILNISVSSYKTMTIENSTLKDGIKRDVTAILTENIKKHPNSYSLSCLSIKYGEKFILYTNRHIAAKAGDTLILSGYRGSEIEEFTDGFSYKKYLEKNGIYTTGFLYSDRISVSEGSSRTSQYSIKNRREEYIHKIERSIGVEEGLGTLVALVTGDKKYMDKNEKEAYAISGTMHLMAVSGMHVVFIFSMITSVLLFLGSSFPARVIKALITFFAVAVFCAIADFAPSVLRAAVTISLILLASLMNRKISSLNSLSASALIITIFDPAALFDPGFQLSFAAVLSIIFINPAIESRYKPGNKIMRYIWQNISISISCQLGVSLITIPMFGYIPIYFILANILLLPLSVIVIYVVSILILSISAGIELGFVYTLLKYLIQIMNLIAIKIGQLPLPAIEANIGKHSISILLSIILILFLDFGFSKTERVKLSFLLVITLIISVLGSVFQ